MIRELESAPVAVTPKEQTIDHIERVCNRFHTVARQLRHRHQERPTLSINDEYDVQDLFHALLRVFFDDVRTEEWTPSYAGNSSRMDFLLKPQRLVIEAKKAREGLGAKELGDQLIIDIRRYAEHPDCDCLVCFVYDPEGHIGNPAGVEGDLSKDNGGPRVRVIVAPR
jgi:hypothetical protein